MSASTVITSLKSLLKCSAFIHPGRGNICPSQELRTYLNTLGVFTRSTAPFNSVGNEQVDRYLVITFAPQLIKTPHECMYSCRRRSGNRISAPL